MIWDLLELLHDVGIAAGHGIGQQIIDRHPEAVDEPHKGIQRKTPFPALNGPHVGVRDGNGLRKPGLRKPQFTLFFPSDLVSYIIIESEAIQDANDKQMISSYCLHKLDLVNWYIDVLDAGDDRYVVPHSRVQLERIRDELQEAHRQIMAVKIKKPGDRPIIEIRYPKGYED